MRLLSLEKAGCPTPLEQATQAQGLSLTPKLVQFYTEYLVNLNGRQASIRVGYRETTAEQQASRLLTKDNAKNMVQAGMDERSECLKVSADDVIQELKKIGFANLEEN